jgi:chromate transporter
MAVVSVQLARAAVTGLATAALAVASAVLLFGFRVNSSWLVLGGAAIGLLWLR